MRIACSARYSDNAGNRIYRQFLVRKVAHGLVSRFKKSSWDFLSYVSVHIILPTNAKLLGKEKFPEEIERLD